MKKGIPKQFCSIIDYIYRNTTYLIKSGNYYSEGFQTTTGASQVYKPSSVLFNLYISNLSKQLHKKGPSIENVIVNYIQYSDDLALIGRTAIELQNHLEKLEKHCKNIELEINTNKTKVQIFYKGRLPNADKQFQFKINEKEIECVQTFTYLGIVFTCQLSFSKHIEMVNLKARSKIGIIFSKIKTMNLTMQMFLKIFSCYILPSFTYGVSIWYDKTSTASIEATNSIYTKYLKRILSLPQNTTNFITYSISETVPLCLTLKKSMKSSKYK